MICVHFLKTITICVHLNLLRRRRFTAQVCELNLQKSDLIPCIYVWTRACMHVRQKPAHKRRRFIIGKLNLMAWIYQDQVHVCVQAKLDKGPWTWKSGLRSKIASSSHVFSTLISDHIVWYEKIKLNICFWLDFTFNLCNLYCMWFCFLKLFLTFFLISKISCS